MYNHHPLQIKYVEFSDLANFAYPPDILGRCKCHILFFIAGLQLNNVISKNLILFILLDSGDRSLLPESFNVKKSMSMSASPSIKSMVFSPGHHLPVGNHFNITFR